MSDSQHPPGVSRRRLFAAAGTAGAVVAAATLARAPHAEPPPHPAPDAGKGAGYRLTEHIQRYYQTTKV